MSSPIVKRYRNRQPDYTDEFLFRYEWNGRFYVIYAVEVPTDPFDKGVQHHHRYADGKLCQRDGRESRTLEHAEAFAYWWMERWSRYTRTGTFEMTGGSVRVPD